MGMPKKIKRNYVLNLLGVLVLFFGLFALFETGVLGSRNSYFMGIPTFALFLIALAAGGVAAGTMGVLVGIPTLKLRGDYLAIVTVAFAEIIRVAFTNFQITGGGRVMSGIAKLSIFTGYSG